MGKSCLILLFQELKTIAEMVFGSKVLIRSVIKFEDAVVNDNMMTMKMRMSMTLKTIQLTPSSQMMMMVMMMTMMTMMMMTLKTIQLTASSQVPVVRDP